MHRKLILTLGMIIALVTPTLLVASPAAAAPPTLTWTPPGDQYVPRTDGRYVVWLDGRGRAADTHDSFQVYGADLTTGEEFPIADSDHGRLYPDVDNGIAVWVETNYGCDGCQGDIAGMDLETGEEFVVVSTPAMETRPAITNEFVFWVEIGDDGETLYMTELFRDQEPVEIASTSGDWEIDLPRADDDKVAWSEFLNQGDGTARYRLRAHDLISGEYYEIDEGVAEDVRGLRDDYDIDVDVVAWAVSHHELYVYDLETGTSRLLLDGGGCPTIDGGIVFYENFYRFDEDGEIEIWGYDLATGANFHVAGAPGEDHEYANVNNGMIVWQANTAQNEDVWAVPVSHAIPTGPETRLGEDSDTYRFFDETRHPLADDFLSFWNASGGLPIFGYPLTTQYEELNPDLGEPLQVQYLERQRFEHHPENAGTPYEVLIGRLGFTAAERAGLLGTEPFQAVPREQAGDDCLYFEETGHTLCGRFLNYWQSDGLEFGDEGVTYRESLALFGLPLSEEFEDPQTGFVSQYFERAIFEYHPEHEGTEFEVLLRRLGVEELQARGWCTEVSFGCDPVESAGFTP